MKRYCLRLLILRAIPVLVVAGFSSVLFGEDVKAELRVYLPRDAVVKTEDIKLGQIGVIRGTDTLVAQAGELGLGRFALSGQQVVIDKPTVLSRLASIGIKGSDVVLSGADTITVRRDEKVISAEQFIKAGQEYLRTQLETAQVCSVNVVMNPKDFPLPNDGEKIDLVVRIRRAGTSSMRSVWVAVMVDGVEKGGREVAYSLKYKVQKAVAVVDIPAGAVINTENAKTETVEDDKPSPAGWGGPYGLAAKRLIRAGSVIDDKQVTVPAKEVIIKRNQNVLLQIDKGGLYITAVGQAMADGKLGDYIRVKRGTGAETRMVTGKVMADGTVEPVF